ncbi:MAG: methyltransferase domain-containing protein [Rubrivivax sp.]|nr:methyltransferase domain-containing protein [Rubrivivax sp.]
MTAAPDERFERAKAAFLAGLQALQQGLAGEAEAAFTQSLDLLPGRPSTLMNLGVARLRQGRADAALQALDQALATDERLADAWGHRGVALAALARHADALASFQRAVALGAEPDTVAMHRLLALGNLRRYDEALAVADELLARHPSDAEAWLQHGRTLQCLGRPHDAVDSYRHAVTLVPTLAEGWSLYGQLLKELGRRDDAAWAFEQALDNGADPELHRWFLAAVRGQGGDDVAPQPPAAYVERLFDGYADDFDEHLQQRLHYRTPQVLAEMVREAAAGGAGDKPFEAALDLGCGTGLVAPLLAPLAQALDGVDLSSAMLAKARELALYRDLVHGDIVTHLQGSERRYGLVVAADVFVYLGALDAVFTGVRRVLQPGGLFAFSVEATDEPRPVLRDSLRYAHGEAYLRGLAAAHGLQWQAQRGGTLREDQGRPIEGLCVLLRLPGEANAQG